MVTAQLRGRDPLGIIALQPFRDRGKFRLSLLPRDSGFEKSITFNPARGPIFEFVAGVIERLLHRRRYPEVERVADERAVESFRRDADDGVLNAVHVLRLANDVRITFVTILPCRVTYDCDRMGVATENRPHAERV